MTEEDRKLMEQLEWFAHVGALVIGRPDKGEFGAESLSHMFLHAASRLRELAVPGAGEMRKARKA